MLGYKRDKLMGLNNRTYMSQETAKKAYKVFNKVYFTGEPANISDWELILKDGSKIYVEGSVSLITDEEGNRTGFRGITRDTTNRVQAEEALRESEAKYRSVFEKTGTATVIIEEDMTISMANTEFEKLSGYPKGQIEGKMKWTEFVAGQELKKMKRYHAERREKGKQAPGQYEFRFIDRLGNIKHAFLNVGIISGTKKSVASLMDITEFKRIEEALRESEEKYRLLVENANDAIFIAQDEVVKFPNPRTEELTGYSVEELVKKPFIELIHPEDRGMVLERHLKRLKGEDFPSTYPFRIINRSGEELWVELSTVLINWEGRPATLNFIRDITEKKKVEIKLLQSQKMEAVANLAGGVAHQFNNALSAITGNIGLIEMDYPQDEGIMHYIQPMKDSVHRMAHLTNQLLAYAKGGKYSPETISLTDFVEDALPLIQHTIKPSIRVETDLPYDILSVNIDITQMQTVLSAIIANSDEAISQKGRIRIITRNEEIGREIMKINPDLKPGTYVCLKVEDDGTGMDEETKGRIFEPFFTTKFTGRGLSMAAVYGIVNNHDGWISIDSEQGKGTTVTLYLPAVEAEEEKPVEKSHGLIKGTGTILVIEDEEAIMDLNRQLLERMGYRVLEARTGKEAVDLAETFDGDIDLALLDIKLPDMGGEKVYPLLIKARPDLKVIVCSGYSIDGPVQDVLDAGAQAFVQKPFSPRPFSEKLKEVLAKDTHENEKKP
jgi:two-component system cell cycle sensor histidine kinase/response regulator CckA